MKLTSLQRLPCEKMVPKGRKSYQQFARFLGKSKEILGQYGRNWMAIWAKLGTQNRRNCDSISPVFKANSSALFVIFHVYLKWWFDNLAPLCYTFSVRREKRLASPCFGFRVLGSEFRVRGVVFRNQWAGPTMDLHRTYSSSVCAPQELGRRLFVPLSSPPSAVAKPLASVSAA